MRYIGISKKYICPCCKKAFYVPFQTKGGGKSEWVYIKKKKNKKKYLCSYSCFCAEEDEWINKKIVKEVLIGIYE